MDSCESPLQLVKSCRGAALSILLILLYEQRPVGAGFLQKWSGYGDKPVINALKYLSDPAVNLVVRSGRYAWALSDAAQDLILKCGQPAAESGSRIFSDSIATTTTALNSNYAQLSAAEAESIRNFSESRMKSAKSSRIFSESPDEKSGRSRSFSGSINEKELRARSFSGSLATNKKRHRTFSDAAAETGDNFSESRQLLHAAGIGEPTATVLAHLDWMTPEYIRAHVSYALKNHLPTGLLIHRMRSNDLAPQEEEPGYLRFISGPFGDLIDH